MVGIPPVLETDAEDVAWALQTADALWKRRERGDAIVWLRRAAQAAGEAEDDDRALGLARAAAELTDWLAQNPTPTAPRSVPPARRASVSPAIRRIPPAAATRSRASQTDEVEVQLSELIPDDSIPVESVREEALSVPDDAVLGREEALSVPDEASPEPPAAHEVLPAREEAVSPAEAALPVRQEAPSIAPLEDATLIEDPSPTDLGSVVPSAAEKHAGMLDPWADRDAIPPKGREKERAQAAPQAAFDAEEVVTSAPPMLRPRPNRPLAPVPPPRPPPAPIRAPASTALDLSRVEPLADLPDDAREAFEGAAKLTSLLRDEEVAGFALAFVIEGRVDVSATIVDTPARRLEAGAVIRARGTIEHIEPIRLVGASDSSRVATWDEAAVEQAFRTCPWVENDLRTAGDRLQAEVGITMGPLGDRLDPSLRADMVSKLALRALVEHEVFATRGKSIPGLLIVGAGELELLGDAGEPVGNVLRGGDFLFPSEVLRAAPAPATVRAAKGGALILFAERGAAQELLVTCSPLLEILASA